MAAATVARPFSRGFIALSLSLAALAAAQAQTMVSISGSTVNMREAPTLDSAVLWELQRGYPLEVTGRRGSWLAVKDFEGDTGWVARSMTGNAPHHIVKSPTLNLRSAPSTSSNVVAQMARGELLKTLEKRRDWVRVARASGETGWVSRRLVWGF